MSGKSHYNRIVEIYDEVSRKRVAEVSKGEVDLERYFLIMFHVGEFFYWVFYLPNKSSNFVAMV